MTYCTLNVVQTHRSFCLIFTACTEVVYDVCVCVQSFEILLSKITITERDREREMAVVIHCHTCTSDKIRLSPRKLPPRRTMFCQHIKSKLMTKIYGSLEATFNWLINRAVHIHPPQATPIHHRLFQRTITTPIPICSLQSWPIQHKQFTSSVEYLAIVDTCGMQKNLKEWPNLEGGPNFEE